VISVSPNFAGTTSETHTRLCCFSIKATALGRH
jgi:hypothetical protein